MKFTVVGGAGFIGSHLVQALQRAGRACVVRGRDFGPEVGEDLGHVLYCAGVTADFRERPYDTVRAHVCSLVPLLEKASFQSLLYLSSTRVYFHSTSTSETAALPVDPNAAEEIFALSKLAGEALCRASGRKNVRIARISNVVGSNFGAADFLPSLLRDAVGQREILLHTTDDSEKDYILVEDAVELLLRIAQYGTLDLYNVAGGRNITNGELAGEISRLTGCALRYAPNARRVRLSPIEIARIRSEFAFSPRPILPALGALVAALRR